MELTNLSLAEKVQKYDGWNSRKSDILAIVNWLDISLALHKKIATYLNDILDEKNMTTEVIYNKLHKRAQDLVTQFRSNIKDVIMVDLPVEQMVVNKKQAIWLFREALLNLIDAMKSFSFEGHSMLTQKEVYKSVMKWSRTPWVIWACVVQEFDWYEDVRTPFEEFHNNYIKKNSLEFDEMLKIIDTYIFDMLGILPSNTILQSSLMNNTDIAKYMETIQGFYLTLQNHIFSQQQRDTLKIEDIKTIQNSRKRYAMITMDPRWEEWLKSRFDMSTWLSKWKQEDYADFAKERTTEPEWTFHVPGCMGKLRDASTLFNQTNTTEKNPQLDDLNKEVSSLETILPQ